MKRLFYGLTITIGIVVISIGIYLAALNYLTKPKSTSKPKETMTTSKEEPEELDEVEKEHGYKLYRPEQTGKVDGVKNELNIDKNSDEAMIVQCMHEMTHQKVQAENKTGAIEMTPNHINTIYSIVKESNFKNKDKLLEILTRWKKKDFNQIVDDHNYFWSMQGGKTGRATGRLTTKEEKEFISNNFQK
ncbi:DUF6241 domain-containing protein [Bacillus mycoides]|uniref:DUF6241 domain-containing protein n=1 Tax=Bacillus mycoides TaxID=1405 RepID=UPI001C0123EA|nr:DUF6241 domain-containing protein [Bacillus mycoides]QWG92777.1 hypothetical protein EXW40_27300 [Bacillus mycoides]